MTGGITTQSHQQQRWTNASQSTGTGTITSTITSTIISTGTESWRGVVAAYQQLVAGARVATHRSPNIVEQRAVLANVGLGRP